VPRVNGTTTERGYGVAHARERRRWAPFVARGEVECAEPRCLEVEDGRPRTIAPEAPWDLAHDRDNPSLYLGPAHMRCNRAEGARFVNSRTMPKRWLL
jgi:hypothetical protein